MVTTLNKILNLTNEELDNIDLSKYESLNPRDWFYMKSGKEHYRLLVYISSLFNNVNLIDIGTYVGESALALSDNETNFIYSFDVINREIKFNKKNLKFIVGNVIDYDKSTILNSPFLILDTYHDGTFEEEFYQYLLSSNYKGFLFLDDINLNTEMKNFWENIKTEKYDLTHIGHWSGSGIVYFS
jgi:hypothetical protein